MTPPSACGTIMEVFRHKRKYVKKFNKQVMLVGTSSYVVSLVAKNLLTFLQLADHGGLPPQTKVREEV